MTMAWIFDLLSVCRIVLDVSVSLCNLLLETLGVILRWLWIPFVIRIM